MKNPQNESDCCRYCKNASLLPGSDDYLCSFKGVVKGGFLCRRFDFDPYAPRVKRPRIMDASDFDALDFLID